MNDKEKISLLIEKIREAEAIVVGGASGMSAAAGYRHYYEHDEEFVEWFGAFEEKYGFTNSFNGFYHRYPSSAHRWAYIATFMKCILSEPVGKPYLDLAEILKNKNYYILTTNQDTQFTYVFPEEKISAIQGDWRYFQCSRRCHDALYPSQEKMDEMAAHIDSDLKIPKEMIPRCPKCGREMEPWVRSYVFLEGDKYREEYDKLNHFLRENKEKKILFLELGVGRMTPMFIQQPFWNLTYSLPQAFYININPKDALLPAELQEKGMAIHEDIAKVLEEVRKEGGYE